MASDFGFTGALAKQFSGFGRFLNWQRWTPKLLALVAGMGQSSTDTLAQDLAFEPRKDGEQSSHGSTGGRSEIERFCQRYEPNTELLKFLKRCQQGCNGSTPTVQPPDQHDIDFTAAGMRDQGFPGNSRVKHRQVEQPGRTRHGFSSGQVSPWKKQFISPVRKSRNVTV